MTQAEKTGVFKRRIVCPSRPPADDDGVKRTYINVGARHFITGPPPPHPISGVTLKLQLFLLNMYIIALNVN